MQPKTLLAQDAVRGLHSGCEVGQDWGYGYPRYLTPEQVQAIAPDLAQLPANSPPQPDPEGYAPDPGLASNAQLQAVAKRLRQFGLEPDNRWIH